MCEVKTLLDVENKSKIQVGISEFTRGQIVLMIAHRMRTIEKADYLSRE